MSGRFTPDEVERYPRDGLLVPEHRLPADLVTCLGRRRKVLVETSANLGQVPLAPGSRVQNIHTEALP